MMRLGREQGLLELELSQAQGVENHRDRTKSHGRARDDRTADDPKSGVERPRPQWARPDGPSMIRDENGKLAGYVFVDMTGRDVGGYVQEAKARVAAQLDLPTGYTLVWSGQYENLA